MKTKYLRAEKEHSERQNRSENPLQHHKRFQQGELSTPVTDVELFWIEILKEFLDELLEREYTSKISNDEQSNDTASPSSEVMNIPLTDEGEQLTGNN